MARPTSDIYVAREAFVCEIDGIPYHINKGERVRAGHPLLDAQRAQFESIDNVVTYDMPAVEQATAAPGEKRGIVGPRRP